jgi:methionyl-tRNA synthetase
MEAFQTAESNLIENKQSIKYDTAIYGALANNLPDCQAIQKFYLTTAIAYTNGYPHIGHAYEFLTSDVLVRYHRVLGQNTFFLTGTDEHGQKVAASAEKAGLTPLDHCDHYVKAFQDLHSQLLVTYSDFMRTTSPYHELTSQRLWSRCADNNDIYLDTYEGWYNEREEVFVSNQDAEACNFLDVGNGLPLKRVTEESYFFRMSKYTSKLIEHIETYPEFIQPEAYRQNILSRLQKEGLKDLSISRTSFTWGIPMPTGYDPKHVMYVWFDALSNYLSGIHALDHDHDLSGFWPASVHVIGKDIVWFHAVIWPCMLFSAGLDLPKCVYAHGFVNASDGRKMSKSYNNAVDPIEVSKADHCSIELLCCS